MARKCIKCNKETEIVLGADPDLTGIAVCEDCKDDVKIDLLLLFLDNEFDEEWFYNKYNIKAKDNDT